MHNGPHHPRLKVQDGHIEGLTVAMPTHSSLKSFSCEEKGKQERRITAFESGNYQPLESSEEKERDRAVYEAKRKDKDCKS